MTVIGSQCVGCALALRLPHNATWCEPQEIEVTYEVARCEIRLSYERQERILREGLRLSHRVSDKLKNISEVSSNGSEEKSS